MFRLTSLLGLSLILHFLLYQGVWRLPELTRPTSNNVEIEVIDKNQNKSESKKFEKPVVENSKAPEPKDISDPAQFIAEKNQRFEKQTRATKLGAFENREPVKKDSQNKIKKNQPSDKSPASDDGDLPEFTQDIQQTVARVQESTVPYDLPRDIESGSATNLNADAHVYASFYNRILNLFYPRWAERLDAIFTRLPADVKRDLSGRSWTTEVEIWLNSEGLYQEGLIMTASGFKPFDEAGIWAFKNAKFFPNPPRSKVEADDGRVRLRYRIRVNVY